MLSSIIDGFKDKLKDKLSGIISSVLTDFFGSFYSLVTEYVSQTIFSSDKKAYRFHYYGMLHTIEDDINIIKITAISVRRDYLTAIGDKVVVDFRMGAGDYFTQLYPYRENLEFSIKTIVQEDTEGRGSDDKFPFMIGGWEGEDATEITVERFKAVLLIDENPVIAATDLEKIDPESLNKEQIFEIKLQLVNRSLEPLRIKTVSGIFRDVTTKDILQNIMGAESEKIIIDGEPAIDGIDLVEPHNDEVKKHVILPHGLHLPSVPSYIHSYMNGVYRSGVGTYMQMYRNKRIWFTYPFFDYRRFEEEVHKVIFYSLPQDKFPHHDRTFHIEGNIIHISITSKQRFTDGNEVEYMNEGVGYRLTDGRTFMHKPVLMTKEGPVGVRGEINHEVIHKERQDNLNYAPFSDRGISTNPFLDTSLVLARTVSKLELVWENCNYNLIYPGMPCMYMFEEKGEPKEIVGNIVFVEGLTALQGRSVISNTYKNVAYITILAQEYNSYPEKTKLRPFGEF